MTSLTLQDLTRLLGQFLAHLDQAFEVSWGTEGSGDNWWYQIPGGPQVGRSAYQYNMMLPWELELRGNGLYSHYTQIPTRTSRRIMRSGNSGPLEVANEPWMSDLKSLSHATVLGKHLAAMLAGHMVWLTLRDSLDRAGVEKIWSEAGLRFSPADVDRALLAAARSTLERELVPRRPERWSLGEWHKMCRYARQMEIANDLLAAGVPLVKVVGWMGGLSAGQDAAGNVWCSERLYHPFHQVHWLQATTVAGSLVLVSRYRRRGLDIDRFAGPMILAYPRVRINEAGPGLVLTASDGSLAAVMPLD